MANDVKIKVTSSIDLSDLRAVNNKLLLLGGSHQLLMISGLKVTTEDETYGRKMNKTRKVKYVHCSIYGYNMDGEFMGTYDEDSVGFYLRHYSFLNMRKNYLEMKKRWEAMHALEEKINEPDFVKAIP